MSRWGVRDVAGFVGSSDARCHRCRRRKLIKITVKIIAAKTSLNLAERERESEGRRRRAGGSDTAHAQRGDDLRQRLVSIVKISFMSYGRFAISA